MENENIELNENEDKEIPLEEPAQTPEPKPRKKRHIGAFLLLLAIILAVGALAAYYFTERNKPAETMKDFLESMQNMDFDSMESMLQSHDLSALDNADVRNSTYENFFREINSKMTYEIRRNSFDIQNGTAQITVHIRYIDGSDIYKETISEFLRQIVSTAFSGEELTEEQTQQKLASILEEKAQSVEDKYTDADIVYPLIKTGDQWKVVSLDEGTVKIMSANFKSVEEEIGNSLNNEQDGSTVDPITAAQEGDTLDMETDKFTIHYTEYRIGKDFAGNPCLLYYYDYTNNGSSPSSAMVDVNIQAYQNGTLCEAAIPESNDPATDNYMAEIQPGETVNVCQVFSLPTAGDVTLNASEAFSFGDGVTASQMIHVE